MGHQSVPYVRMGQPSTIPTPARATATTGAPIGGTPTLYEEQTSATRRAWVWLPVIAAITLLGIAPVFVPVAVGAWLVNVVRYRRAGVRLDPDYLWVGRRCVRLAALDLTTLGRAGNTWPWRAFSRRYLGANPIWTRDSVAVRGIDGGRPYWVAVGTNHREELVEVLRRAVPEAKERASAGGTWAPVPSALPPPAWHPDPWDPAGHLRWWDGRQWTGHTWPRRVESSLVPPSAGEPPGEGVSR